jgi:hypothetical protein
MRIPDVLADHEIKPVAADFVVARVCDLNYSVAVDVAKRQIERSTTPIEYKDATAIEIGKTAPIISLRSKVPIESRQRFVNKLNNPDTGLSSGLAQSSPASPIQLYRNGHDRSINSMLNRLVSCCIIP